MFKINCEKGCQTPDLGVGELETLQSVMDEIKAMNKEYASYSGAPEGATVTSRYVFRTKEESSK